MWDEDKYTGDSVTDGIINSPMWERVWSPREDSQPLPFEIEKTSK